MPAGLSMYGRSLLIDEAAALAALTSPVLVWGCPDELPPEDRVVHTTASGTRLVRPRQGEPLVFELRKGDQKTNAFAMAITVGRTINNDVVLPDASVSRFHAYFQQDGKANEWRVVDAESKNGTWLGPLKLTPNVAETLIDKSRLRFGSVEVTFMQPQSFVAMLREALHSK